MIKVQLTDIFSGGGGDRITVGYNLFALRCPIRLPRGCFHIVELVFIDLRDLEVSQKKKSKSVLSPDCQCLVASLSAGKIGFVNYTVH